MTFQPERLQPPGQPRLADAAQLRGDGASGARRCRPGRRCPAAFMGRSPDHLASSLVGQRMGIDVFRKHSEARAKAFAGLFRLRDQERPVPHLRDHQSAGRARARPGASRKRIWSRAIVDEDATGITIRGAKMLGTSSIMANEVFVANLQPLKPGEEGLAFSCALPMNAKGLRVLSRKSYEAHAVSIYDNPLSSRFDENDALMYFDDVKVPWERLFVYRDTDMCRAQFHDTPGARLSELSGADPAVGEDRVPGRARAPHHRGDRHDQHPVRRRAAWHAGGAGRHGQRDAVRHGGLGLAARRVVGAEQAFHVFGAGADPGPLSAA